MLEIAGGIIIAVIVLGVLKIAFALIVEIMTPNQLRWTLFVMLAAFVWFCVKVYDFLHPAG